VCEDAAETAGAAVIVEFGRRSGARAAGPHVCAHLDGARAGLTVLPEPPCAHCRPAPAPTDSGALAACTRHALAALAASEALLVLLAAPRARRYLIDLRTGSLEATPPVRCAHGGWST
jgi:hypothetical protein